MENNIKELETEEIDIEDEFFKDQSNWVTDDNTKLYFNEIAKYKVLTPEEEIDITNKIKNPSENKLLQIKIQDGYNIYGLKINLLFSSLINSKNYNFVIKSLISYYESVNNTKNTTTINILRKYQKLSNKLNRALNEEELEKYFNIKNTSKKLSEKELLKETSKYITFRNAYDKMVFCNLKLVVSIAKKYNCSLDLLDLVNEGNCGLLKAIDRYKPEVGAKFSSYATWWIRQAIVRAMKHQGTMIRIPECHLNKHSKLRRDIYDLEKKENRSLSDMEIAKKLNITLEEVDEYRELSGDTISLEVLVGSDKDSTLINFIEDENSNTEEKIFQEEMKKDLYQLLEILNEKEKLVVSMRYGLTDGKIHTLGEIGEILSLTRERIRQIELVALDKMKKSSHFNSIKGSIKDYIR